MFEKIQKRNKPNYRYCPNCGAVIKSNKSFCDVCRFDMKKNYKRKK